MEQQVKIKNSSTLGTSIIGANTIELALDTLEKDHIIPSFGKDNEPVISQMDFIQSVKECGELVFSEDALSDLIIRASHPINGRIPEAKGKSTSELLPHEKTVYMERLIFNWSVPNVVETIEGNRLSLSIGGIKCYSEDNLYSSKGSKEHFKVYIGFLNAVCSNLCIWTDGSYAEISVSNLDDLKGEVYRLLTSFNADQMLSSFEQWTRLFLSEQQFAQFIGKAKLYPYAKPDTTPIALTDYQISATAKGFYADENFSSKESKDISLWNIYNLMTGAVKSSYLDSFLPRNLNACELTRVIESELLDKTRSWYLN